MKDKFTMELVWHNCATHPPKEDYNNCLLLSDGRCYFDAEYIGGKYSENGEWYDIDLKEMIPQEELQDFYWADMRQTVGSSNDFNV
jgi:hypothetical protein